MSIHPEYNHFLARQEKESLLNQRGLVVWMCGLSGSGKSTISAAAERVLHQQKHFCIILDGDNIRSGLNADLDFTEQDRLENVRRIAEISRVLARNGVIVLVSAITPLGTLRDLARGILGDDLFEVYVRASYETCEKRDVKGLYAKASRGEIAHFTGKDGSFEEPADAHLVLDTEELGIEDAVIELIEAITPRLSREV